MYTILASIKGVIRRLQLSKSCVYKSYDNPSAVGGWLGWYENPSGTCIAFVDTDHRIVFDW